LTRARTRLRGFEFRHEVCAFDGGEALHRGGWGLGLQVVRGSDYRRITGCY
jgi:hypothetical protein